MIFLVVLLMFSSDFKIFGLYREFPSNSSVYLKVYLDLVIVFYFHHILDEFLVIHGIFRIVDLINFLAYEFTTLDYSLKYLSYPFNSMIDTIS